MATRDEIEQEHDIQQYEEGYSSYEVGRETFPATYDTCICDQARQSRGHKNTCGRCDHEC